MKLNQVLFIVSSLPGDNQDAFFESLKKDLSPEEIKALQVGTAYFRQLRDPGLHDAMKNAIAEELYKQFTEGK